MLVQHGRDEKFVGEFNFENIGFAKIWVYGDEENLPPHFHIINESTDLAVCIFDNAYLPEHSKYTEMLTDKDCEMLNKWFAENISDLPFKIDNWNATAGLWESSNGLSGRERKQTYYSVDGLTPKQLKS
jgi:hypothetical protein